MENKLDTQLEKYNKALESGDVEEVKNLLTSYYFSENKNLKKILNDSLIVAVSLQDNSVEMIRFLCTSPLLKKHARPDFDSKLLLKIAVSVDNLAAIEYLCTSPELKNHSKYMEGKHSDVFISAVYSGKIEIVKFFLLSEKLKRNVRADITGTFGENALEIACENNNIELVKLLTVSSDVKNKAIVGAVHIKKAIMHGYNELAQFLLTSPEINFPFKEYKKDLLESVCIYNNLTMLKFLTEELKIKFSFKTSNYKYSDTPFEKAAINGSTDFMNYLFFNINYRPLESELIKVGSMTGPRDKSVNELLEKRDLLMRLNEDLDEKNLSHRYKL